MVDYWQDRIALNPVYKGSYDAGTSMPAPTDGTIDGGINQTKPNDRMSSKDISNDVRTMVAPQDPAGSWGLVEKDQQGPADMPGTQP